MISAPSPASPTFRADLAKLISPLKRIRPRVPFWQLAAHRIPTLSLYRGLLRNASTEDIRFRVRMLFRKNTHLTGTERTIKFLNMGYKWLDIFQKAKQGDEHYQAVLKRYSSLIAVKCEKAYWMYLGHKEMAWRFKLRSRPILTSVFTSTRTNRVNPHYPRLKPQPVAMSMIIKKRRLAATKRHSRFLKLSAMYDHLKSEGEFEKLGEESLSRSINKDRKKEISKRPMFADMDEWMEPITNSLEDIQAARERAIERSSRPIPEWLIHAVKKARTNRIANKTRELERERQGEVLPRTIKRRRKGPPAHVLAKMTPEEKKMDKVVRSVSEVGYVAMMKRKFGIKMRNPDAWRVEVGSTSGEEGRRLRKLAEDVRKENERRRLSQSKVD
ncbi:hypothetical protein AX14_002767 [Amanita brunnescens Koide BX004]|nr:hypothetical protein AX14_002767 [Amanita brunnescens Koide BX004]